MSKHNTAKYSYNGYEYYVVGECKRTGRPIVAPIAWTSNLPRPSYATCICCQREKGG
jgi:hypothetical protein